MMAVERSYPGRGATGRIGCTVCPAIVTGCAGRAYCTMFTVFADLRSTGITFEATNPRPPTGLGRIGPGIGRLGGR